MIVDVLPASQISQEPASRRAGSMRGLMVAVVVLTMAYTLLVGWGLLAKQVAPESAYLLMAVPCILPAGWYAYGFIKVTEAEQDFGLLLSALGWVLVLLALLVMHSAQTGGAQGGLDGQPPQADAPAPPAVVICAALGAVCLIAGALISWRAWLKELRSGFGVTS